MPENRPLFDPAEFPTVPQEPDGNIRQLPYPLWTEHKATLISRYLRYFVYITKHGTYIDGFAGPQNDQDEDRMWAAKLVITSQPAWLRHFHLVELDPEKIPRLEALRDEEAESQNKPKRTVDVYHGDFNEIIDTILDAGTITPNEATFCLLDQRTFECKWRTLERIAAYKPSSHHKIELFYFLSIGWLDRALAATKHEHRVREWWGRDDWQTLRKMKRAGERAKAFCDRFVTELGYASSLPWPIFKRQGGGGIMYFMIHASDHPEAPKLMDRAYRRAVDPLEPPEQLSLELGSSASE